MAWYSEVWPSSQQYWCSYFRSAWVDFRKKPSSFVSRPSWGRPVASLIFESFGWMESALGGSQFTFMQYWLSLQWLIRRCINLNNIIMQSTLSVRKKSLIELGSTRFCSGTASAAVTSAELQRAVLPLQPQPVQDVGNIWSSVRCFCECCSLGTHNFVRPLARPSNFTFTPRRGDVLLFLRQFFHASCRRFCFSRLRGVSITYYRMCCY